MIEQERVRESSGLWFRRIDARLQIGDDLVREFVHASLAGLQHDLGVLGRFIGAVDAGEVFDLACAGLPVKPLGIALLADLQGGVDEDFNELAFIHHLAGHLAFITER